MHLLYGETFLETMFPKAERFDERFVERFDVNEAKLEADHERVGVKVRCRRLAGDGEEDEARGAGESTENAGGVDGRRPGEEKNMSCHVRSATCTRGRDFDDLVSFLPSVCSRLSACCQGRDFDAL